MMNGSDDLRKKHAPRRNHIYSESELTRQYHHYVDIVRPRLPPCSDTQVSRESRYAERFVRLEDLLTLRFKIDERLSSTIRWERANLSNRDYRFWTVPRTAFPPGVLPFERTAYPLSSSSSAVASTPVDSSNKMPNSIYFELGTGEITISDCIHDTIKKRLLGIRSQCLNETRDLDPPAARIVEAPSLANVSFRSDSLREYSRKRPYPIQDDGSSDPAEDLLKPCYLIFFEDMAAPLSSFVSTAAASGAQTALSPTTVKTEPVQYTVIVQTADLMRYTLLNNQPSALPPAPANLYEQINFTASINGARQIAIPAALGSRLLAERLHTLFEGSMVSFFPPFLHSSLHFPRSLPPINTTTTSRSAKKMNDKERCGG